MYGGGDEYDNEGYGPPGDGQVGYYVTYQLGGGSGSEGYYLPPGGDFPS